MQPKKNNKITFVLGAIASAIAGYFVSALMSPTEQNTIFTMMERIDDIKAAPFKNYFNKYTVPLILLSLFIFVLVYIYQVFGKRPMRNGEEYGSSQWGNPVEISNKLADRNNSIKDYHNIVVYPDKSFGVFRKMIERWKHRKDE